MRHFHFSGSTAGNQLRVHGQVLSHGEGVLQVAFNFVEHILGATSKENGAGLGVLAFQEVGEIFVTNLGHTEQAGLFTDIRFLYFVRTVDDLGTSDTGNTLVVGLADSANHGNIVFLEMVGCIVGDALLGNHDIRLPLDDLLAHVSNFIHFLLKGISHVAFLGHFHRSLTFTFLVLQWGVQKDNPRVADFPAHLGMHEVLVEHHTVQYFTVLEGSAGDFFHFGVALDI